MKMVAGFLSLVLLVSSSVLALDTFTTEAPTNETMSESSAASAGPTAAKSAQINLPGIGEVDLSSFQLPSFSLPKIPTIPMPNMSLPVLPSLPKLFSEVPCLSLSSGRPGVCRKQEACVEGVTDGPCALGLGVCCTQPLTCGQTIIVKDSVIANPGYPAPTTGSSQETCAVTIIKRLDTVQIRLDLEVFDIAGPDANGVCSEDVMEVTGGNTARLVPRICGLNHGQHLYVPVDKTTLLTPVTVKFTLNKSSQYARSFRIRVRQLGKESPLVAPAGCSQLFTGEKGVVHSFNYERVKNVGIRRIAGLEYGVCFQKQEGRCGVRLQPALTRVTRSLVRTENRRRSLNAPPMYAFFPAHHNVWLRRPAHLRPRYVLLNRPPIVRTRPQPSPMNRLVARPPVYARPVVYYPTPQRPVLYYKPVHKLIPKPDVKDIATDKKNKAKDEIDGIMIRKKVLIDEIMDIIKKNKKVSPDLSVLPDLKGVLGLKGLPAIPEIKLPVLPTLPPLPIPSFSLTKLPKLDVSEILTLSDLLKKHKVFENSHTGKKVAEDKDKASHAAAIRIKAPVYGHYYPQPQVHPVKVKPSLFTKVDDVSEHKPSYGPRHGQNYHPAKKTEAKKPAIISAVLGKDGKTGTPVRATVVSPSSLPAEVVPAAATILKTEPFAILVQDGGDLTSTSRGFAIQYEHQVCA